MSRVYCFTCQLQIARPVTAGIWPSTSTRTMQSQRLNCPQRCAGSGLRCVKTYALSVSLVKKPARQGPCQCSKADAEFSPSDIAAAWQLLKKFSEEEFRGRAQQHLKDAASREKLRDALMLAYQNANLEENWNPALKPEVLLGVVASEGRLAVRALRDWCQALGLQYVQPDCKVLGASSLAAVQGAVYVKYNSASQVCYLSQYTGSDRGVLVQLGPGRLLGHFPLGFFDEQMNNPEPSLGQQGAAAGTMHS